MVEIKGNFIIGTGKSSNKPYGVLKSITWDIEDKITLVNNVIYSINGKHKFIVRIKLWLVGLLFRRDFKQFKHTRQQE